LERLDQWVRLEFYEKYGLKGAVVSRIENWIPEPGDFAILTDWATVGVMLGMVVEAWGKVKTWEKIGEIVGILGKWVESLFRAARMDRGTVVPGQALAELLLELWGRPTSGGGRDCGVTARAEGNTVFVKDPILGIEQGCFTLVDDDPVRDLACSVKLKLS
jgi:hypothetical protein